MPIEPEEFGNLHSSHIHIETIDVYPHQVNIGDWVLMPTGQNTPSMQQVIHVGYEKDDWKITTTHGLLSVGGDTLVKVVA